MIVGDRMNKPLMKLAVIVLLLAGGGMAGCKKSEVVYEADLLGTWEIKAWNWSEPTYYTNCDMLGTLSFAKEDWGGGKVTLTFTRDGLVRTLGGYADLTNLPIIKFDCYSGSGFPDNLAFRGLMEDGGMIGSGGFYWDMEFYDDWEWEAVKK
jgi:hypothetical protein